MQILTFAVNLFLQKQHNILYYITCIYNYNKELYNININDNLL